MELATKEINEIIDKVLPKVGRSINEGQLQRAIQEASKTELETDYLEEIIDKMIRRLLIFSLHKSAYAITDYGKEILDGGGWLKYVQEVEYEKNLERQERELTVKHLKQNIFHLKNWGWFMLFSALAGGFLAAFFQFIIDLMKGG